LAAEFWSVERFNANDASGKTSDVLCCSSDHAAEILAR
jgi:hypothetical protein